ncbi:MAG: bifunctional folylpolyglutamate synthase/dihydrofolate synthase [Gemmatimonadota bacterium]|nr:bifunctional folylpolyglutamate synthase/dihydrofolate synthase [Gemmatimonadota bacterium]
MDIALNDYRAALDYLFARTTGTFKFGLERTRALLAELGDPHLSYPVLHIAGTNGKGSSVATSEALLRQKGLVVGRYTSPHLVDFRERIVVGGAPIPEQEVVQFIEVYTPAVERIGASFFEATTAMAFLHFAKAHVDVALIETGLGGRLDSTNVVEPRAAGVTSIGFDHMEYLGPTLADIAFEKAGIFKRGCPAVIGEPDPVVRQLLVDAAVKHGVSSVHVTAEEMHISDVEVTATGTRFLLRAFGSERVIETPLVGRHQAANFAFTLGLLDAAGDPFRVSLADAARAVATVRLPGRFQRVGRWVFDVAHNPDGARTLAASLRSVTNDTPVIAVLCVLGDKDWRAMIDELATVVDHFILTNAPTAPSARAWSVGDAFTYASARGLSAVAVPDFAHALEEAEDAGRTAVVTGSFHTVGDAMDRLQVSPFTG